MRDYITEGINLERFLVNAGADKDKSLLEQVLSLVKVDTSSLDTLVAPEKSLNEDQQVAWDKLAPWSVSDQQIFVLAGYAGTGKSFMMKYLANLDANIIYSATTNKAAKVLGNFVGTKVKTTYSVLGLRMVQDEDRLILSAKEVPPYIARNSILVIDEASMVGKILFDEIMVACNRCGIRALFVGDPAQLPPVGEARSLVWRCTNDTKCKAMLRRVMRNDNQLLALATKIRNRMRDSNFVSPLKDSHDATHGVWKHFPKQFHNHLVSAVVKSDLRETKVIAWRNKTVNEYNQIIRSTLGFRDPYCVGDIILLAEPVEINGNLVAHVDEEFSVQKVTSDVIRVDDDEIDTWQLQVQGDRSLVLQVPKDVGHLDVMLSNFARIARGESGSKRKKAWKKFWDEKAKFNRVRYGYTLTAHRAQGSSYHTVYVDQQDILANSNHREAFRCLYVACTRPTVALHSF